MLVFWEIKSNYRDSLQTLMWSFWESLCLVRMARIKNIAWLTDTSPFSLSVKVWVDWWEVVAVCLLPSVWDVWLDSARQNNARRFPRTDRCVKAESALETQPCHLQHATVSFPLTSSGSETSLLYNSKERHSRIFIYLFVYSFCC